VPYVRTVTTKSGATAVQVVYLSRRGSRDIEHLGSVHDEAELEALKAAARQQMMAGQLELGLGMETGGQGGGPLPITSSRMGYLLDALQRAYQVLELAISGCQLAHDLLRRVLLPRRRVDVEPSCPQRGQEGSQTTWINYGERGHSPTACSYS
jgi:hypothetical protein